MMAQTHLCFLLLVVTWAQACTNIRLVKVKVRLGGEITVNCSTALEDLDGLYLYWSQRIQKEVLYLRSDPHQLTIGDEFQGRVTTAGNITRLSVTVGNLTVDSYGLYWCQYRKRNKSTNRLKKYLGKGPLTMVLVTDPSTSGNRTTFRLTGPKEGRNKQTSGVRDNGMMIWVIAGLSASFILLTCVISIYVIPRVKRFQEKRKEWQPSSHDVIYEDMHPKLRQMTSGPGSPVPLLGARGALIDCVKEVDVVGTLPRETPVCTADSQPIYSSVSFKNL